MKKRIFMLLMTMVLVLGMGFSSLADEVKYYEGVAEYDLFYQEHSNYYTENINVTAVEVNDQIFGQFTASNGDIVVWSAEVVDGNLTGLGSVLINNQYETEGYGSVDKQESNGYVFLYTKNAYYDEEIQDFSFDYHLTIKLNIVESQAPHQISAPFTGIAESDTGNYTLALAGYYTAELTDGTHVLSASDITAQTIAIVAYNKANGVKRVMRETTIEEMTVTVSGGIVTEYIIRGRVQTDGGTLDRYTATINP